MIRQAVIALCLVIAALHGDAHGGTTTVEDLRGTVQTITTTGTQTVALGANTTIVRFNASSLVEVVGISGGADGRIVFFWNVGSANVLVYNDHASATATTDRIILDANGGYRTLYNGGVGIGMAVYDGTTGRWRFSTLSGYNATGSLVVNGDLAATSSMNISGNGTVGGTFLTGNTTLQSSAGNRLLLKSLTNGNNGSSIRWLDYNATALYSMGPDYNGNAGKDWWLYDNYNGVTNLYLNNTGTSYLSFGTSGGGMQYAESTDTLDLFASGNNRMSVLSNSIRYNTPVFYRRQASGTSRPTLNTSGGDNCNGSGTATWANNDSSDQRGAFTLGTGASSCKMTFATPYDLGVNYGQPICTANSSTSTVGVAITTSTDHYVVFTPSSSGATTIYYHCDGLIPPP